MTMQPDKKALTQWSKSAISYNNYQEYINKKPHRFELSLIDLLYVSNFKGGNATINEPETAIKNKLIAYSKILIQINNKFNNKSLIQLTKKEIKDLTLLITSICNLTEKKTTKIDGFKVVYLSALLSSYFPTLIPILDRRVLINLNLVTSSDIYKNGQIKNIQKFYLTLVKKIAEICNLKKLSVRDIDKFLFTTKLLIPAN